MNKITLLVLGASLYQLNTILAAKQLGYRVITTDNLPDNPGHQLADKAYNVDITDLEGVLDIARKELIDGVIAACTDVGVPTAAYIANQCQLQGPTWPDCLQLINKSSFRNLLKKQKLLCPDYFIIGDSALSLPPSLPKGKWIIKPECSSGSKGVFILTSQADLRHYLSESFKFSPSNKCIIERFIEGQQGTCEGILKDGVIISHLITDRITAKPPYVVTQGHITPSQFSLQTQKELIGILENIFNDLGISNSPFDCDFIANSEGIYLLEVSPRMGGNGISRLVDITLGFDFVKYNVQQAVGQETIPIPVPRTTIASAVILFGVTQAGCLDYSKEGVDWASSQNWVNYIKIDYSKGSQVNPFCNGRERIGEALIVAKNLSELEQRIQQLIDQIAIKAE